MKRVLLAFLIITILTGTFPAMAGEIHEAASAGDLSQVKTLLKQDPKLLNSVNENGATPWCAPCSREWNKPPTT